MFLNLVKGTVKISPPAVLDRMNGLYLLLVFMSRGGSLHSWLECSITKPVSHCPVMSEAGRRVEIVEEEQKEQAASTDWTPRCSLNIKFPSFSIHSMG